VRRWAELVTRGPVLDVASGGGRHALLFAERGFEVVAVDRDAQAIAGVRSVQADLESAPWPFAGQRFAAIVVTNYLHRPLFPTLAGALEEEGVLIYETFMPGVTPIAFEQGYVERPKAAMLQRLCATRGHIGRVRIAP